MLNESERYWDATNGLLAIYVRSVHIQIPADEF